MLPVAVELSFDEVHNSGLVAMRLPLPMGFGALAYMRSTRPRQRVAAVSGGLVATWLVATAWVSADWHGRQEPRMTEQAHGYVTPPGMSCAGVVLILVLVAPGLLELAQWGMRYIGPHKPPEKSIGAS